MSTDEREGESEAEGRAVAMLMLGTFLGTVAREDYPIKIRDCGEWGRNSSGQIDSLVFVTESGLRLKVRVDHAWTEEASR
jgi:hypothetical protein